MTDDLVEEIAALGPVQHLIAPNRLHHTYVTDACDRYPGAQLYLAPGLQTKRPDLPEHKSLPAPIPGLSTVLIEGAPALSEVVVYHPRTRTLIVTDLVFHVTEPAGILSALILWLAGPSNGLGQSRAIRFMTKDREAARKSVDAILAFDFERVVMAHGEVIETNVRARLKKALSWMRHGAATRGERETKALPRA